MWLAAARVRIVNAPTTFFVSKLRNEYGSSNSSMEWRSFARVTKRKTRFEYNAIGFGNEADKTVVTVQTCYRFATRHLVNVLLVLSIFHLTYFLIQFIIKNKGVNKKTYLDLN